MHDFLMALDAVAELGERDVLGADDEGCYALIRAERQTRRLHALAPPVDAVSYHSSYHTPSTSRPMSKPHSFARMSGIWHIFAVSACSLYILTPSSTHSQALPRKT